MWPVIFWGLKFEACYFLGRPKISSNEFMSEFMPPPDDIVRPTVVLLQQKSSVLLCTELILDKFFRLSLFSDTCKPNKRFINIANHVFGHGQVLYVVPFYESL